MLPTIPLFTLAGYFLAEGGASKRPGPRLQRAGRPFRGGPAIATALACAFFTSFTGASGVTILALGGLLMPVLLAARYSERAALGLLTGAGSLGLLFPPCLPLILYAIVAKVADRGDVPRRHSARRAAGRHDRGCWAFWQAAARACGSERFRWRRGGARALWAAKWELLLPVVALVGAVRRLRHARSRPPPSPPSTPSSSRRSSIAT